MRYSIVFCVASFALTATALPIATEERRNAVADPFLVFPGQSNKWVIAQRCKSSGTFCVKETREDEPVIVRPEVDFVNPEGCTDPLLCAALKKREAEAEAEAEAEPVLVRVGYGFHNVEGCGRNPKSCGVLP